MEIIGDSVIDGTSSTVNGLQVLLNGGSTGTVTTGTFASRPAAGTAGNLYVDTINNVIWRDTGSVWIELSTGSVLQTVQASITNTTGTTTVATAVTAAPTTADGFLIWTQSFTPISASSKIIINFALMVSTGTANRTALCSVFAGSTNVGTTGVTCATTNVPYSLAMSLVHVPGSTSAITYTCRIGPTTGATIGVQQYNTTTGTLGNAARTEYIIQEIL